MRVRARREKVSQFFHQFANSSVILLSCACHSSPHQKGGYAENLPEQMMDCLMALWIQGHMTPEAARAFI